MSMGLLSQKGFGLTEGLLALVVLSTGLLAIYSVHSAYLRQMNDETNRTEALYLTSQKIGGLRYLAALGSEPAVSSVPFSSLRGQEYTIKTLVESTSGSDYTVTVTTSWDSVDGPQQVSMNTRILAIEPTDVFDLSTGGLDGGPSVAGTVLADPTGEANYGDGKAVEFDENQIIAQDDLGLTIVEKDDGYYLLDNVSGSQGTNLLESKYRFFRIKGSIYLYDSDEKKNTGIDSSKIENLYAGAPDVSVCKTDHPDYVRVDSDEDYYKVNYVCYVGAGWYGRIGLIEQDQDKGKFILGDADACVGNDSNDVGSDFSNHPQASITRRYFQYAETGDKVSGADGTNLERYEQIGFPKCEEDMEEYINGVCEIGDHHFLVTGGSDPNVGSCDSLVSELAALPGDSGDYGDNPGKNFCLSSSDFCPYLNDEPYAYSDEEVSFTIGLWNSASGSLTTSRDEAANTGASVTFTEAVNGTVISGASHTCDPSGAFYSCSFVPALGEGFSSTWSSYAIGDLEVVIDSTVCTGNPADSDQLVSVSGGVTTILRKNFRLSGSGQEVHLTGCE